MYEHGRAFHCLVPPGMFQGPSFCDVAWKQEEAVATFWSAGLEEANLLLREHVCETVHSISGVLDSQLMYAENKLRKRQGALSSSIFHGQTARKSSKNLRSRISLRTDPSSACQPHTPGSLSLKFLLFQI